MARDIDLQEFSSPQKRILPRIGLLAILRLGLFQVGLGIMSVLTLAVINRVMISELAIPATITAGAIALPQLLATPTKVWFGQLSDAKPLLGYHRSSYVWLGTALFGALVFISVQVVWQLGSVVRAAGGWVWTGQTLGWSALLALIFALYGLAINISSVPYTTLLVDVSEEDERSKITSIAWSMLMVGIVAGAVTGSRFLDTIQPADDGGLTPLENLQAPINTLFMIIPLVVLALAVIATVGIEKRYSRYTQRSTVAERAESITLARAVSVLTASRQTGIFFVYLLIMTLGLFMQEAVLEPYGGEVFGLTIAQTTQLNAFWGVGILIGLGASGFLLASRIGKLKTARVGCLSVAVSFGLVILAGFTSEPSLLRGSVFLFGLAAGVTTTGSISLMLDLTAAETAGTFIGAWGLAQGLSRGVATFSGGVILDFGKVIFNSPVLAYGLVFSSQAVLMLLAIALLNRVNIREFRETTKQAIATVMEGDLEG